MYYAHYLLHSHNLRLEGEIPERLANSLVRGVRKEVIGFLNDYLVGS